MNFLVTQALDGGTFEGSYSPPHPNDLNQNQPMDSTKPKIQIVRKPSGFSLVELLVVMGIIALIIGMGAAGMKPPTPRPAHAMEIVADMAGIAQSRALALGARERVAICVDTSDGERYLRCAVNVQYDSSDPTNVGWKITNRVRPFPTGTIFWPDFSTTIDASNTMQLDPTSPGSIQSGTSGVDFVYLEFDSIGEPTTSGVQWVFARAVPDETGAAPIVPEDLDRDGFILRQTGRLSFFQSPDQISDPNTP